MLEGANDVRSVLARATGFEPGTAQPTGTATNLRIELMPARYVEVSVVLENGLPAPAGIRVVAYGDDAGDLSALAQDALANHPGSLSAATDANGLARLDGLSFGVAYRVTAGGAGFTCRGTQRDLRGGVIVPPDARQATLVVACAYACELLIVDGADGSPATLSAEAWGVPVCATMLDPSARSCLPNSVETLLCGVTPGTARPSLNHQVFMFSSAECGTAIGPLRIRAGLPGYEDTTVELVIPRLSDFPATSVVPLRRTVAGFGELSIEFTGLIEGVTSRSGSSLPDAIAKLSSTGGFEQDYAVRSMSAENRIGPIPQCQYFVSVAALHGAFRWPPVGAAPILVDVGEEPTRVDVDLSQFGALQVDIADASGSSYSGPLQLELAGTTEPRSAQVLQAKDCPCHFQVLPPSRYSLRALAPFVDTYAAAQVQTIEISAGSVTAVRIRQP